jgi:hypothetical protein
MKCPGDLSGVWFKKAAVAAHPDDDRILECAVDGKADPDLAMDSNHSPACNPRNDPRQSARAPRFTKLLFRSAA